MLVGASLPPVYAEAAALARRIEKLKSTRAALSAANWMPPVTPPCWPCA